ncbi:peptidylprolyl isomerase [Diaphorobacter nitroreducens]|uniref:peptidylprolyl isomerase n=1 Tax=Diaphorobacter nitroreducens TaxID=164759 RepID=UPI00289B5197|nr:peptidylprolyl isomerase [Diaphorobacter nitroreducens]
MSIAPVYFSRSLRLCTLAFVVISTPLLHAQPAPAEAIPLVGEGLHAATTADVAAEVANMDKSSRQNALSSPDTVQRIATEIYVRRRLAAEAVAQKLDQQPQAQRMLQIVRERIFADLVTKQAEDRSRPTEPVLENLARQNYLAQQARFRQPERIHARHILIPLKTPNAREHAADLRQQALSGASFEELAKKYSKDPGSASKGGDLGFFTKGKMVKPFEDAAFALIKPGDLSDVIESNFGYHIIQLVEKRDAGIQPFDEVKKQLIEEAAGGVASSARQELIRPLLDAAKADANAIEAFSATYR